MIRNLKEFELLQLFESLVQIDNSLIKVLSQIDHPISHDILSSLNQEGFLDTQTDMKDTESVMVSDSPDSLMYQRKGRDLNPFDKIKLGRFVRKISDEYKPEEIEDFTIRYKTFFIGKSITPIELKGEELRKSYLIENTLGEIGDFSENCMRHEYCQPFLDIYAKNPDKVSVAVVKSEGGLIAARALLWKTDFGDVVMDRIYSADKMFTTILQNWASEKGYYYRAKNDSQPHNAKLFVYNGSNVFEKFTVTLKKHKFPSYPFLDTFCYMDDDGTLYNYIPEEMSYKELRSAQGTFLSVDYVWYIDQKADSVKKIKDFLKNVAQCEMFQINNDLTVDLKEDLTLIAKNLRRIPINFRFINGNVNLSTNNLESLEGLPKDYIYGYLDISNNPLRSLEYCPKIIQDSFDVSDCGLETLTHGPEEVGGDYAVNDNHLKNLNGLAKVIKGSLIVGKQKSNTDFNKINIRELSDIYDDIIIKGK